MLSIAMSAQADNDSALRGKSAGCNDNHAMNLWDISGDSPLIRNDMLRKGYCFFPTFQGLHVRVIENIGKFSRVANVSNGASYLVYRSDITKVAAPQPIKSASNLKLSLTSVKNSDNGSVYSGKGGPTVKISMQVAPKFYLDWYIPKSLVRQGYDETTRDSKDAGLQIGGNCSGAYVGVSAPEWYRLKIIELDNVRKTAVLEVSGFNKACSLDDHTTYYFENVKINISGRNVDELVRPHTAKELTQLFDPYK